MRKTTENIIKGIAVGVAVGSAAGAVSTYVVQKHPKEVKRMMHKAAKTGEQVVHGVEKMLSFY